MANGLSVDVRILVSGELDRVLEANNTRPSASVRCGGLIGLFGGFIPLTIPLAATANRFLRNYP